jgi:hypothetical protein
VHLIGNTLWAAALVASAATAQVPPERDVVIMSGSAAIGAATMGVGMAQEGAIPHRAAIGFISGGFGQKTVTGAPYSAEGVTEFTRTLADGTRIKRNSTSLIYRDSQGRTRQEHTMEILGPLPASGEPAKTITITDPVEKAVFILEPSAKTATRLPFPTEAGHNVMWMEGGKHEAKDGKMEVFEKEIRIESGGAAVGGMRMRGGDFKTEALGKRTIEGVVAEGTRTTTEIPAGQVGNDRPITIVMETWHSPELQTVVTSTTMDPMSGDSSYRLTNINRAEPAASLFQVPPDYTLRKDAEIHMMRKIQATPKTKQ